MSPKAPRGSKQPVQQALLRGTALMDAEAWLRRRLVEHGVLEDVPALKDQVEGVTLGLTSTRSRADRLRKIIVAHGLQSVVAGGATRGKPETYAEVFERIYGEPLITEAMRDPRAALRGKS